MAVPLPASYRSKIAQVHHTGRKDLFPQQTLGRNPKIQGLKVMLLLAFRALRSIDKASQQSVMGKGGPVLYTFWARASLAVENWPAA